MVGLRRRGPDPLDFCEPRSPLASDRWNEHAMLGALVDRRAMRRSLPRLSSPKRSLSLRIQSPCRRRKFESQSLVLDEEISQVRQRIAKSITV
jgi:hypothetical protein